jgi:hypothetical protein
MDDYLKVEGNSNLFRDPKTNSIINANMSDYQEYLTRKTIKNKENEKIQNLESDLAILKDDIGEIKNLLRSIANGSK